MSRHPDPCYCEQAQAYEALLLEVFTVLKSNEPHNSYFKALQNKIETIINEYQEAQAQYTAQGAGYCDPDCDCTCDNNCPSDRK